MQGLNQDFESISLEYAKYPDYGLNPISWCMQGSDEERTPYTYSRSFRNTTVTGPPPDLDKEALDAYIRSVLGVKGPKKKETTS